MFGSSDSRGGDFNGFLDAGSHIKGELHFEDNFRIEGKLTGSVVSDGELVVGDRGEVEGDVKARRIFVSGTVRGTLRGTERVEISSTGRVLADLFTPTLKIEEGAVLEGRCSMKPQSLDRDRTERDGSERGGSERGGSGRDRVTKLSVASS